MILVKTLEVSNLRVHEVPALGWQWFHGSAKYLGLYLIVTSQYSSTTSYKVSYHIQ